MLKLPPRRGPRRAHTMLGSQQFSPVVPPAGLSLYPPVQATNKEFAMQPADPSEATETVGEIERSISVVLDHRSHLLPARGMQG